MVIEDLRRAVKIVALVYSMLTNPSVIQCGFETTLSLPKFR